jgi:hypothetical protein
LDQKKTGVVDWGKVAATHASAWRKLPVSELVGVCDRQGDPVDRDDGARVREYDAVGKDHNGRPGIPH